MPWQGHQQNDKPRLFIKLEPRKNILQNLIRNSNPPQIIPLNINSNPQINQSQIGNSNTEQSNILIVSGSILSRIKNRLLFPAVFEMLGLRADFVALLGWFWAQVM